MSNDLPNMQNWPTPDKSKWREAFQRLSPLDQRIFMAALVEAFSSLPKGQHPGQTGEPGEDYSQMEYRISEFNEAVQGVPMEEDDKS